MHSKLQIAERILTTQKDGGRQALVDDAFHYQVANNPVYGEFVNKIRAGIGSHTPERVFLPVELFKNNRISCKPSEDLIFKSSGTTGTERSTHYVYDKELYNRCSKQHFESIYGSLSEYTLLALLPSYEAAGASSLVHMVHEFMHHTQAGSAFVLHEPQLLANKLKDLKRADQKVILFGVSYALLDFAEAEQINFPSLVVMETGGMKGRRTEMTRSELHEAISKGFPASPIHAEYGMTELLSQAYSCDGKWFDPPNWLIPFATEISDPLHQLPTNKRGLLAFIDLANYYSCSFIQTKDIGMVNEFGQFTVEGRLDNSDLRGCNLLYT